MASYQRRKVLMTPSHIVRKDKKRMLLAITHHILYGLLVILHTTNTTELWIVQIVSPAHMQAHRLRLLYLLDETSIILIRLRLPIHFLQFCLYLREMMYRLPIALVVAIPFTLQSSLVKGIVHAIRRHVFRLAQRQELTP